MIEREKIQPSIKLSDINKVVITCSMQDDSHKYAFYIYKDNKIIEKIGYGKEGKNIYWVTEPGEYKAKIFVKDKEGNKESIFTEVIQFEGLRPIYCSNKNEDKSFKWIKNVIKVCSEIWCNRKRMSRLAKYDYYLANKDSYLGKLWSVLNPLIQIGTYWFVFGVGIRSNSPMDGHPFLVWMLCGLIPWFFISYSITKGAGSIHSKAGTLLKLRYPVSTIPMGAILVGFYNHLVVLGILVVMLISFGYYPNWYWLNLIYYFIFEFIFLTSLAMITSVLTMIARDFQKLITSLIRLLFYLTPILWNMERLPDWIQMILKLNPVLYIVEGFRDSLLYHKMFYVHYRKLPFFWTLSIILLIIGCNLQVKFRDRFLDMM